ncbi:hypothetical protein L873DRAFT_1685081 [Choiromyces venosus 120613-1]|uniref:Zn(2)-C6 fungal-type domain-containing protein n=1 Tax=Choiromyces venosus 120613-1 TaxID=1336337 RepID=A0A3N4JLD4_9PEZI|nr:hypothetical protein L873DRAFT_1685081 [Choiromyces venosus 120613-1]
MVYHKPRKSCLDCRRRHLKCEVAEGSSSCIWCSEHGLECIKDLESQETGLSSHPAKDGAIILTGSTSAFGGFQLSKSSFLPTSDSNNPIAANRVLRLRQDLGLLQQHHQHQRSNISWGEAEQQQDTDRELRLDKPVQVYLRREYFARVHPYIPILTEAYLDETPAARESQLLLAAMYGVAARLPAAIVSTRDFLHIKRVFEVQLKLLLANYRPSLEACQALTLIHLTLEMQCEGLEGVEAWPLRLASAVRMALELKLNDESTYPPSPPYLAELHRRLFWALFTKDRWTSTGKGYPLMLDTSDIHTSLPSPVDLDSPSSETSNHEFFIELVHQALTLGAIHPICFRADRYVHVTPAHFRRIEDQVNTLGTRLHKHDLSPTTLAHLHINYAAIRLLFYGPFFKPSSDIEAALFNHFIPNISSARLRLANEAVHALSFASKELLFTGPSIWSILFYATVRCFLVALSVKHDPIGGYSPQLRSAAGEAVDRVNEIARFMCEERRWGFMVLSGTLVLFTKRVAEDKDAVRRVKGGSREGSPATAAEKGGRKQGRRKRKVVVEEVVKRGDKSVEGTAGAGPRGVVLEETVMVMADAQQQGGIVPAPMSAGNPPPQAAISGLQVPPGEYTEFVNWDLGNDYSEDIDWKEWDMMFSGIAG